MRGVIWKVCFSSPHYSPPLFLSLQEDQTSSDKSDDLVKVLRELIVVQRNIANLQVELQGRKVMFWYPVVRLYMFAPVMHHAKTFIIFHLVLHFSDPVRHFHSIIFLNEDPLDSLFKVVRLWSLLWSVPFPAWLLMKWDSRQRRDFLVSYRILGIQCIHTRYLHVECYYELSFTMNTCGHIKGIFSL